MNDQPEKDSAYTTDRDRYMEITKFAWDEKVNKVKTLQHQNEQLKDGLKAIEVKLAYLTDDGSAKRVVMSMIDELFDAIQQTREG